jgi:LPXTG-motif cell wall-anchored protein
MKKTISLILCVIMVMTIATCAFAKLPLKPGAGTGGQIGGLTQPDPDAVKAFKALVDAIGEVTLEDKEAIEAAEAAYDGLLTRYKVENQTTIDSYATLTAARTAYDALVAAQNKPPKTGDGTMMFVALAMLAMTGLVVLVSKKKAY